MLLLGWKLPYLSFSASRIGFSVLFVGALLFVVGLAPVPQTRSATGNRLRGGKAFAPATSRRRFPVKDLLLAGQDRRATMTAIREERPEIWVFVLTNGGNLTFVALVLQARAGGYVHKRNPLLVYVWDGSARLFV